MIIPRVHCTQRRVAWRVVLAGGLLLALVAVAGCGSASKTIRVAEPNGTLDAHVGDTLVITFRVQPGVGFTWALTNSRAAPVLTLKRDQFEADKPGLVGGPGNEVFTFNTGKTGTAVLTFHHAFRGQPLGNRRVVVAVS
jgi:predicted secreted protein